jgi:hypothetical protein
MFPAERVAGFEALNLHGANDKASGSPPQIAAPRCRDGSQ